MKHINMAEKNGEIIMKKTKLCFECSCSIPKFQQPAYYQGKIVCPNCFNRLNCWNTGKNKHGVRGR